MFRQNDFANDTECRLHVIRDFYGLIWSMTFNKPLDEHREMISKLANK